MNASAEAMPVSVNRDNTRRTPLHPEIGVVAVVPERWGGMWLSRQQILTRLAGTFRVAWVDPQVGWRRLWFAGGGATVGQQDDTPAASDAFLVCRQHPMLPRLFRPPWLARTTTRLHLGRARRALADVGCRRFILYVWQPRFAESVDLMAHDASCYHIADEYSFADIEAPITPRERRLIERVDDVFIHSPALMEKKGNINPNTTFVTNGVDYPAFSTPHPEPADLASIPHPRIGYVGRIKVQLDWALLESLATRRPDWSFVFVGPMGTLGESAAAWERVSRLSNVHYLGPKTVTEIPAYTQHIDVGLLSYRLNAYTRYIYPLKLHEYLAAGLPVVGSDIRSLREFHEVVTICHTADEWEGAIDRSIGDAADAPQRVAKRRAVAARFDWDALTGRIAKTLCTRMGINHTHIGADQ